jgi:murein DD-endopeptidase MepM/ murein hydrolase activator NlpD
VFFCLCETLIINSSAPLANVPPFSAWQKAGVEASLSHFEGTGGVGGGSSLVESTIIEEEGMLEPESFSKPQMLLFSSYTVKKDDFIGDLAESFGLSQDTLISINSIRNTRLIQIGQVLRIPNQDGIMYTVKNGDTLDQIAKKYESEVQSIQIANELFSDMALPGTALFIPGARLDWMERQEINGDLFIWPISGYITSSYGWRRWPFGGGRQFHSGIDIGGQPTGAPVRAAMSGRVSSVGWDNVLGNFVVITHHTGYRTMYGHLSAIRVKSGAYVGTGERIGDVGSTGMSTGPHLHFTVYKNGVTVNPRTLMK